MENRERDDEHLDETVRRLLEPNPLSVERLVRRALDDGGNGSPARERPWPVRWPALTATAVAIVLLILLVPPPGVETPAPPTGPPADPGSRLTISNVGGVMSVTSTSGSQWILLPGDDAS